MGTTKEISKVEIESFFKSLQDDICKGLEELDRDSKFEEDLWTREEEGGGGRSRIIQNGKVFEKGGVNFSAVYGPMPEKISEALKLSNAEFYASGVSIVIHPGNPWIPIIHMNVRYFEMETGQWWFGGGIDLTPHYIIKEDAADFHRTLKTTCDLHHPSYYPEFKKWADDYFYITHREETRGIGGIFFDRLNETNEISKEQRFEFVQDVGRTFLKAYSPLVLKYREKTFAEAEKKWQHIRRGRYVEFNLVYDKGTKFGLDTKGRIESILMSLPPHAEWLYNFTPAKGSMEETTQLLLKKNINWI